MCAWNGFRVVGFRVKVLEFKIKGLELKALVNPTVVVREINRDIMLSCIRSVHRILKRTQSPTPEPYNQPLNPEKSIITHYKEYTIIPIV